MGLISNLFTESEFDDYRFIEKVLREADNDDDDDNFDMPDDGTDDTENQSNDVPNQGDTNNVSDGDDIGDGSGDDDFDMPDDTTDPQGDGGIDTQSMDNNPEPQSADTTMDIPADDGSGDTSGGDEENFDLPDDDNGQAQDASADNMGGDQSTGDNMGDDMSGGDDENFDMDDGTADGGDGSSTDMSGDGMGDMSGGTDPDQDLKDAENDIFNGLSDQDKTIKINELKDLYQDLYNRIVTLYDKVNDIPKDDELIKVYNFIIDNLSDLKQFVYDYLTNTFDNKTYLENMVNYKKYLSTLNVINGILEEIRKGLYKESGN